MGEVGVGDVGALPGQDAEEAEEHHDAELEDVLYAVDLEVWELVVKKVPTMKPT